MATLPSFAAGDLPYTPAPEKPQESSDVILRKALKGFNLGGFDPDSYADLVSGKSKAAGDAAKAEAEQKRIEAQGKAAAEKTFATGLRQQYQRAEPTLMSAPPKFNVTKDTEQGLMGLAALMTVGSLIIGSKGAASGVNAMNAMTGVLKGYQEGNQQRIDFETKKYEQSIKEWERTLQQTKESLARYEKLASADLNAAISQASAEAAAKGQEVIAAKLRQGGFSEAKDAVDKLIAQTIDSKAKMERAVPKTQTPIIVQDAEGKAMYANRATGEPMRGPDGEILRPAPKATSAGQNAMMYASRVYGNIEGASQDLVNIANSPAIAQSPVFAGIINADPTTVSGSLKALVARKMAPEEERAFDQLSQQVGLALSRLEAQGLASGSTQAQVKGFDALRPKAGDSAINMALYLAKVRQEIETGIKVHSTMSGANPDQKKNAQARLKEVQDAIPFTVNDVLNVLRDNKETLSDSSKKLLSQPGIATGLQIEGGQTRTQAVGTQPKIAKQEDVVATANARFGGDIEKAKKALRERGFEIEGD